MSNTPETDALDCELHNPRVLSDRYSEMRDFARKLERERDEARAENETLRRLNIENSRLASVLSQEREHNGCQALMWRSVAEGLAKALEEAIAWDSQDECGEDAVWLKMAQEALRMFEEAGK